MSEPEPPKLSRVATPEAELAYFEWNPSRRGRGPSVLLAHATGFHARCWDPVVARLGDVHVVAVDLRGHGRSSKLPISHWDVFGRDLAAFVDALGLDRTIGVGHSMGGHAMTEAAAAHPARFERLLLIDPVIASPGDYGTGGWTIQIQGGELHPTARRKNRFASPQAMFDRFADRKPYALFTREALRAYCEFGLLPAEDGDGYVLACPPEIEASIYMTSRTNPGVYDAVRALTLPVVVVRAKAPPPDRSVMDFSSSPTWPGLAGEFANAREIHLADRSHFVPMEIPEWVAAEILGEGG